MYGCALAIFPLLALGFCIYLGHQKKSNNAKDKAEVDDGVYCTYLHWRIVS